MLLMLDKWRSLTFLYSGVLLILLTHHGTFSTSLDPNDVFYGQQSKVPSLDNIYGNQEQRNLHGKPQFSKKVYGYPNLGEKRTGPSLTDFNKDDLYDLFQEREMKQYFATAAYGSIKKKKKSKTSELQRIKQERENDIKRYSVLLIPWLIFPISKASYFTTLELFDAFCDKIGVPPEITMVYLVILQGVDFVALTRGRWKFLDGAFQNMEQEMLDYFLHRLGAADHQKIAAQLILPSNDWPDYEEKK